MGWDLWQGSATARTVFEEADDVLRFKISRLCFEGPSDKLRLTENTQPALLTVSVALLRLLEERGLEPDLVAGHSLGEYSALVAAGALSFADAVRTVRDRGRFMQQAVQVGSGAMAAVLGLDRERLKQVCRQASQAQVVVLANLNCPGQIVISGHTAAVERASALAREQGAKALLLPVSAPFHSPLMAPAQRQLAGRLARLKFCDLAIPLVNNVEARLVTSAEEAQQGLVEQVTGAVLWTDSVKRMAALGIRRFVEVGPGKVLSSLIRRINRKLKTRVVGKLEQVIAYD